VEPDLKEAKSGANGSGNWSESADEINALIASKARFRGPDFFVENHEGTCFWESEVFPNGHCPGGCGAIFQCQMREI